MACLLVPAAEAVITTVIEKAVKSKEEKALKEGREVKGGIRFSEKLGWLNKMLWGGSALLAFEHVWHGEIIPVFPFLTAVRDGNTAEMLVEMGSAGVMMAVLVTAVWAGMAAPSSVMEKRAERELEAGGKGAQA